MSTSAATGFSAIGGTECLSQDPTRPSYGTGSASGFPFSTR